LSGQKKVSSPVVGLVKRSIDGTAVRFPLVLVRITSGKVGASDNPVHVHRHSIGVDDRADDRDHREDQMFNFDRVFSRMKDKLNLLESSHHESSDIVEMPGIRLSDGG